MEKEKQRNTEKRGDEEENKGKKKEEEKEAEKKMKKRRRNERGNAFIFTLYFLSNRRKMKGRGKTRKTIQEEWK